MRRAATVLLVLVVAAMGCSSGGHAEAPTSAVDPGELALRGDGLGVAAFGGAPAATVAAVARVLGPPSGDTGWEPSASTYGTCPGTQIRAVRWDALVLLFTNGATTYGRGEHLFSWQIDGAPPALSTAAGLGFGATAADAAELYPSKVQTMPAEDPVPGFLRITVGRGVITAFLDGADTITSLAAGVACAE